MSNAAAITAHESHRRSHRCPPKRILKHQTNNSIMTTYPPVPSNSYTFKQRLFTTTIRSAWRISRRKQQYPLPNKLHFKISTCANVCSEMQHLYGVLKVEYIQQDKFLLTRKFTCLQRKVLQANFLWIIKLQNPQATWAMRGAIAEGSGLIQTTYVSLIRHIT